tara:strand:+ start:386 stop:646 length:261 start_codon:yes stop_codon:yes gene_type:complete
MSKNKKKLGYSQYENLLANAHQKLDFLAEKFQELQTYFIGYVEFHGENVEFNSWMEARIKEIEAQIQAKKDMEQESNKEDLINEEV